MSKNGVSLLLAALALLLCNAPALAGDLDRFASLEGTLDIAGGTAHIPVMNEAAKRIMSFNPKIRITVAGGGTGIGVQKAGEGLVDIGNTGRPLSEGEVAKFGLQSFDFAIDGVAPIVHPEQPRQRSHGPADPGYLCRADHPLERGGRSGRGHSCLRSRGGQRHPRGLLGQAA